MQGSRWLSNLRMAADYKKLRYLFKFTEEIAIMPQASIPYEPAL